MTRTSRIPYFCERVGKRVYISRRLYRLVTTNIYPAIFGGVAPWGGIRGNPNGAGFSGQCMPSAWRGKKRGVRGRKPCNGKASRSVGGVIPPVNFYKKKRG